MIVSRTLQQFNKCLLRCPYESNLAQWATKALSTDVAPQPIESPAKEVAPNTIKEQVMTSQQRKAWIGELKKSIQYPDYFGVAEMFTVEDLFNARVHLGHREGTLNQFMTPYIFGSRLSHLIFDLDQTAEHLRRALNFLAHIIYRDGIVVFACRNQQLQHSVEELAMSCGVYAHCREWKQGVLTNSLKQFGKVIRLPDCIVLLSTHDHILEKHKAVHDAAKMRIPTIGIVDSNVDPRLISYPIPGNDDSPQSVLYIGNLMASLINKVKTRRADFLKNIS